MNVSNKRNGIAAAVAVAASYRTDKPLQANIKLFISSVTYRPSISLRILPYNHLQPHKSQVLCLSRTIPVVRRSRRSTAVAYSTTIAARISIP